MFVRKFIFKFFFISSHRALWSRLESVQWPSESFFSYAWHARTSRFVHSTWLSCSSIFEYAKSKIFAFSAIPNCVVDVKEEIKEQYWIYLNPVETFLENYLCSSDSTFFSNLIYDKLHLWRPFLPFLDAKFSNFLFFVCSALHRILSVLYV